MKNKTPQTTTLPGDVSDEEVVEHFENLYGVGIVKWVRLS